MDHNMVDGKYKTLKYLIAENRLGIKDLKRKKTARIYQPILTNYFSILLLNFLFRFVFAKIREISCYL